MRCNACRCNGARGGVFVSPAPAYADGYVDGTGNNIYYGFKTDAQYAEAHFNIDVEYYDTFEHAKAGGTEGIDPLGKFVRVHYLSNSNNQGVTADEWKFRPMWWFGVPAGLQDPQYIHFKRIEKLTQNGRQKVKPAGASQYITTDANGYGAVSDRHYNSTKEWSNLSNFYFSGKNIASKGWKQLVGLGDKEGSNTYDNAGNTEKQWDIYKQDTKGLKGIFVDWESAGRRWYDMTYVSEMEDATWKNRDKNPLRFAAGVYRFAGNWHYAAGQKHDTPKIADYLKLAYPEVTKVKDPSNVTSTEQETIKDKIKAANKDTKHYSELVDKVEVSDKGVATITFKDNTTRTMPASLLVTKDETDKDKYRPALPTRTPVVNPSKLTADDKTKVIAAFKTANKDNKDFNDNVKADPDGIKFNDDGTKLIVTYQDGSKLEINASELVCQGAAIADWAPYVVPDYIDVDDLKKLKQEEITKIVNAFDTANTGITPYDKAKTKNGNTAPVAVDPNTGNATITWEDGSTTTISAWQFLKEKPKQNPEPSTPTQQGDKTFIVEAPATQTNVNFDPLKMTEADLTNQTNTQTLNGAKALYIGEKGKDAKEPTKKVNIKSVEYSVEDGVGYITFNADGYTPAKYPMSVFFKQKADKQTPTPDTTLHHPGNMTAYQYYVDPVQVDNVNSPSGQDQIAAFKKFIQKNYTNVNESELATGLYSLKENNTPVSGVKNMQRYVQGQHNGAGVVSFSVNTDGTIAVQGFEIGENNSKKLFDVPLSDLYVAKSQQQKDNTIDHLKAQAKALLDKRRNTDKLTNDDLKRAGIVDPDQLNDAKIDSMAQGQTAEKDLRDLIRKLTDAKKAERKYNPIPEIEVTDPVNLSEADFKKAAEEFLKANYDGTDSLAVDKAPYTVPTSLKPKTNTVLMELASDTNATGISSITYANSDFKTLIFKDKNNKQLFTVSVKYKKKAETPAPTPDALAQMKKDAEQQIDRNPNLTDDQKKQYKQDIEGAKTVDKIKEILNKAAQQGKNNQNDPSKAQTITDNKGGGDAKKEAEDKKQKEEEEHNKQQLQKEKTDAKNTINSLTNLTDGDSGDKKKLSDEIDNAQTSEEVKNIIEKAKAINDAKGALQNDITKGALPFLCHGDSNSDDDNALKELIGADSKTKDATLTALETALTAKDATAESINNALAKAKLQNTSNEQNAKNAGIAKLEAKKAELDAAYNALSADKQQKAKEKYDAAVNEINTAKGKVNSATKPSEIKTAVDGVKTSFDAANKAIEDAKGKRDTTGNTNDDQNALKQEKEKQIERINNSGLSDGDKQKAIDDINAATKLGDPEGIANRYLKHKKIEDAKKQIDKLDHLNKAQKKYYKDLLDSTDASDHVDETGNPTGKDDIDDALEQALNLNGVMKRLADLATSADALKKDDKGKKYSSADQNKKDAFDAALNAANTQLDKVDDADSDNINADGANALYNDLLKAMQGLDSSVKGVGLYTDDLKTEYDDDVALKEKPVYKNATKNVKEAFDKALEAAKTALDNAKDATKVTQLGKTAAEQQNAIGAALANLVNARKALDGIDTTALQAEVNKDKPLMDKPVYNKASEDKKNAFDKALAAAEDAIADAEGRKQLADDEDPKTQEQKQKAVNDALTALQNAAKALDGKETTPTPVTPTPVNPTPTPAPSPVVDKSHLQQGINDGSDVHDSDDYTNAPSDKKQAYDHALDHANEVNKDPNATQDQVNQAAEDLKKAQQDLHDSATVNKSYLQWEVSDDVAFRGRGSYLVADASLKDAYNAALSEARSVLSDANAMQEQVNAALAKLREAKRNILQANGLSGEEYAGDGTTGTGNTGSTPGTGNTGSTPGTGNTGAGDTGAGDTGAGDFGFGNTGTVPGTVPGSGDSGFGSTGTTNSGTTNSGSGHEGDSSLGFGVNDNAPTTVDKGELNLQIEGAESGSKPGSNSGAAGNGSNSAAGAGSNAAAGAAGNAAGNAAAGAAGAGSNAAANAANAAAGAAGNAAGNSAAAGAAGAGNAANGAAANGLAAAKVNAAVENSQAVKRADAQVALAQAAVNTALAEAKKVAADPNATQAQVDAAAQKLADARKSLAAAQDNASKVRAAVREQVLKSVKGSKLSKTGTDVSVFGMFAAGVAAAGAALFVSKRRGISRHCSK